MASDAPDVEEPGPDTAPNARVELPGDSETCADPNGGVTLRAGPDEGKATPGPPAPPADGPTAPNARVAPIAGGCTPDAVVLTGGRATGATEGGGGTTPVVVRGPEAGVGCGTNEPDAVIEPANRCVDFIPPDVSPPKTWVDVIGPERSTPPPAGGGLGAGGIAPWGEAMKT